MIALVTPKPSRVSPEVLVGVLRGWLAVKRDMGDASVLTQAEWAERCETCGESAAATMLIDGSVLYRSYNYGECLAEALELNALAESLGYYVEMGFAWSLHFYPTEE